MLMQLWLRLSYDLVTGKYLGEVGWVLGMSQPMSVVNRLTARGYSGGPTFFVLVVVRGKMGMRRM